MFFLSLSLEVVENSEAFTFFFALCFLSLLATMLSTKGKPTPLPSSSPLLSSKLKQASLDDEQPASASATVPAAAAAEATGEERQEMKQFWEEHSKTATVEEMMLDSKASEIDQQERPEVRKRFFNTGAGSSWSYCTVRDWGETEWARG